MALIADEETDMATKQTDQSALDQTQPPDESNTVKNPDEWKTGDEPMTGAQRSYLKTLSDEASVPFEENLTKAEASKRIDQLRQRSDRLAGG
jgi:hypothetical protein